MPRAEVDRRPLRRQGRRGRYAVGNVPAEGAIDVKDVKVDPADMKEMTTVDKEGWKAEIPLIKEHFAIFGAKLPKALTEELAALEKRLG